MSIWVWRLILLGLTASTVCFLDTWFYAFSREHQLRALLGDFLTAPRAFGEPAGLVFVSAAAWLLDRPRRRLILFLAATVVLAGFVVAASKLAVGRERPFVSEGRTVVQGPQWPGAMKPDPSFPSGHTTAAFALAFGLSRLYPQAQWVFWLAAIGCGLSRTVGGKHFLSDCIVGAWFGWEFAHAMWNHAAARVINMYVPASSWYPRWMPERAAK